MNNGTDHTDSSSSSKLCSQEVRPKTKHQGYNKGSQLVKGIQNGSALNSEKINCSQNGASCSSAVSAAAASSSSSSPPPPSSSPSFLLPSDVSDVSNGEHLSEKYATKGRTSSSEENESGMNDKKRKTGSSMDNESSSGNEGDEGLSGDDCCIYTYKGDQFVDLPNSLFSVDVPANGREQPPRGNFREMQQRRRSPSEENEQSDAGSSPEMDFLEMDFDPGPSLEQDSEEDQNDFEKKSDNNEVPELPCEQLLIHDVNSLKNLSVSMERSEDSQEPKPGPSNENVYWRSQENCDKPSDCSSSNVSRTEELEDNHDYCCSLDENSQIGSFSCQGIDNEKSLESGAGDMNSCSSQFSGEKRLDKKILPTEKSPSDSYSSTVDDMNLRMTFNEIMLWTEEEAISKQVTLLSSEISCGATAVINVMLVLKLKFSIEKVKEGISARLKCESMSIPQYLVSRSFAGAANENLIRGIHHASQGKLYARFFQMYPRRNVVLSRWLCHWMKKGAVPIATMNIRRDESVEDSTLGTRHHQMIYGVNSKGIHLSNPLECLEDDELWRRLNTPSTVRIKRKEIVSRWSLETNLRPLMYQSDDRWKKMNVLGQVVNIIRESSDPRAQGRFLTQHISIPASSGITLVIERDSPAYEELVSSQDLPFSPNSKSSD